MTDRPRVAIKTLGCKLNQYESEQLREDFEALGFEAVPFRADADVYVVNTCTVTHRTDRDARRLARQARRRRSDAVIILTGCCAEMHADRLEALGVADVVAGNDAKPDLARLAAARLAERGRRVPEGRTRDAERLVRRFPDNTRAFVKVQEGCDAACAYCIITIARGPSRSVPPETVLRQIELLARSGHPEVVLVGTHLGAYGRDLGARAPDLAELVRRTCDLDAVPRVRLSSIEPCEVSDELVEMVCAGGRALAPDRNGLDGGHYRLQLHSLPGRGKVCRHLHIPLQSGCDATLKRMNRPYDRAYYRDLVEGIVAREPRVCIGADVLTGFPGETDEEFEHTLDFVRALPVAYLHVFTYSERPGTPAAGMPGSVNPEVRKRRTHMLRDLSRQKMRRFATVAVGERLGVVVETPRDEAGRLTGISDNYLRVAFEGPDELVGRLAAVDVTASEDGAVAGSLAE